MELIPQELKQKFKKQGDTSQKRAPDIMVLAKFFAPWGASNWFATDYDEEDNVCFGYVNLGGEFEAFAELGYFSIDELEETRGPFGLKIERDLYWKERTLQEVMDCRGHL